MATARTAFIFPVILSLILGASAADLRIEPGAFGSGKAYVRCTFDGLEQNCFVDTGSAMTLLPSAGRLAKRKSSGRFRYKSASGKVREAETIEIGTVALDGRMTRGVKIGRLARPESESTLGMDILGRFPFAMDFRTAPKLLVAPRRLLPGIELRPLSVLHSGLLALPVSFAGAETLAVWDTGASITAVDSAFVRANPAQFKRLPQKIEGVDGTGEKVRLELFRAKELRVGTRIFKDLHVMVLDLSPLRGTVGNGVQAVLGFNAIRKADWYFDRTAKRWGVR